MDLHPAALSDLVADVIARRVVEIVDRGTGRQPKPVNRAPNTARGGSVWWWGVGMRGSCPR
jgi:hypothetical protein